MLKCGQKDNTNYTFGLRPEQIKLAEEKDSKNVKKWCANCSRCYFEDLEICPNCKAKLY